MHDFTPLPSLIGGMIIGLAASIVLFTHGKVAGISGLVGGALRRGTSDRSFRLSFLAGLILTGIVVELLYPAAFATSWNARHSVTLVAGVLVGFGTQLGNGCTSGHGVCGVSRLSIRSLVATLTFMGTAIATVYVLRHVIGAAW